jgi:hydrogenase maturation protease
VNATATDLRTQRRAGQRPPVLVVGVGSDLRSDDAAGRWVAEIVARAELPGVEVRSVHQLTPELAAAFAHRRLVVVVDASVEVRRLTVALVEPAAAAGSMSHHFDVRSLIALSDVLGQPPDEVVTVAIPAHELGLGTELSAATAGWLLPAAGRVTELCEEALGHDENWHS